MALDPYEEGRCYVTISNPANAVSFALSERYHEWPP